MSDTTDLVFQVRAINVDDSLPHKSRAEEIRELPQFLEVSSLVAPGLALLNVGEEEPGSQLAGFPWLKLDSSGNPLGLYKNVGGTWKSALDKYFMRELLSDMVTERGTLTVTLAVAADTFQEFRDMLSFSESFDDVPKIKLWVIGGTIMGATGNKAVTIIPDEVRVDKFNVKIASNIATNTTNKTVEFLWEATGKRAE